MKRTLAALTTIVLAAALSVAGVAASATADEATPDPTPPTPSEGVNGAAGGAAGGAGGGAAGGAPANSAKSGPTPPAPAPPPEAAAPTHEVVTPPPGGPAVNPAGIVAGAAYNAVAGAAAEPATSGPTPPAHSKGAGHGHEGVTPPHAGHPAKPQKGKTPRCLRDSAISYTYSPALNSGVVTVTDSAGSTGVLCQPVYLTAVSWKYTQNAKWPQTLDQVNKVLIDRVGTYPYSAAVTCGQGDIYVSRTNFIVPTPTLAGPQSWERFLSRFGFSTTTPGNTYVNSPTSCYTSIVTIPAAQPVTFADVCGVANDLVSLPTPPAGSHYSYQKTDGRVAGVGTVTVVAIADTGFAFNAGAVHSWSHEFKSDADNKCVVLVDELPSIKRLPSSVTSGNDTCTPTGVQAGYIGINPSDGLSYFLGTTKLTSAKTIVTPGTYTVTAVANPGDGIDGPSVFTVRIEGLSASCGELTASPTSPAAGAGTTSPAAAAGTTSPTASAGATTPVARTSTSARLASTGFSGIETYLELAAALLMLGAAFVFVNTARRKSESR